MAVAIKKVFSNFGNALLNSSSLVQKQISKPQVAGLVTKAVRDMDPDYKRPQPFDHVNIDYRYIFSWFENTTWRFDENSKVIVVDGPVTSGKDKIAKGIAETFDLRYFPHVSLDPLYVNSYGYSLRDYNLELPFMCRSFEPPQFIANPYDRRAIAMQMFMSIFRLNDYIDALNHVLNTGQGVVMNRSIYSDFVFVEACVKSGFYRKEFQDMYYENWKNIDFELMRPHLIIYLDTPVDMIRENLKKRGNPVEINSPVYQPDALKIFEDIYKNKYLTQLGKHAEVLSYNMEDFDYEVMVEDMEDVNLSDYEKHDSKMNDWRLGCEAFWNFRRMKYTKERDIIQKWWFRVPNYDVPEAFITGEEQSRYDQVKRTVPGNKYEEGFNKDMGDSNLLFKFRL